MQGELVPTMLKATGECQVNLEKESKGDAEAELQQTMLLA